MAHLWMIQSPAQALALVLLGMLAVCLEFAWPGRYVAGAAGLAACMVGVAALAAFPLPAPGLWLVALAAAALAVHARRRFYGVPLAAAALLLPAGLTMLTGSLAAALALSLPASLALGLLLEIARRSRDAKRQPIKTGLDARPDCPHNKETRSELRLRENRTVYDDQDQ